MLGSVILLKRLQGSKIALVRSYLRVPQVAGQVENLIFLVKINFSPIYVNNFCDAGQVPILRYFEPWLSMLGIILDVLMSASRFLSGIPSYCQSV